MNLLYLDRDRTIARTLHGEFLSYRGLNWNLVHTDDFTAAKDLLENELFHTVLFRAEESADVVATHLREIVNVPHCPSVVTVTESLNPEDHLCLIATGADDSLNRVETSSHSIMRRLRIAETRRRRWESETADSPPAVAPEVEESYRSIQQEKGIDVTPDSWLPAYVMKRKTRVAHLAHGQPLLKKPKRHSKELQVTRFDKAGDLVKRLDSDPHAFDALLVEQSTFEQADAKELEKLHRFLMMVPGIVLTLEQSDFSALSYIEKGYRECMIANHLSFKAVQHVVQKVVLLHRRVMLGSISQQQVGTNVVDRRKQVRNTSNRRRHVRFKMERPVVAIPVLPNGGPDIDGRCNATSIDVSLGGVGLIMPATSQLPNRNWVIGVKQASGTMGYLNAYLRRVQYQNDEINAGLVFQSESNDLFRDANLSPDINPNTKQFEGGIGEECLEQWSELGILTKRLNRRVKVCVECECLCTIGTGCSQCGSFDLDFADLIHHFACAHIDNAEVFDREGSIDCPKCLQGGLVVGADFEIIRTRFTCRDCDHHGDVTAQVANCLQCQLRFPIEMAPEIDVYGYHIEQLDILALVDAAR